MPSPKQTKTRVYSEEVVHECWFFIVIKGWSYTDVSKYFKGRPSIKQVQRWATTPDENGKTWENEREERRINELRDMSPQAQAAAIDRKVNKLLCDEEIDPVRCADALHKMLSSREKILAPQFQVPTMYYMLQEFTIYIRNYFPKLLTKPFQEAVRSFKNHLRAVLDGDFSAAGKSAPLQTPKPARKKPEHRSSSVLNAGGTHSKGDPENGE